MCCSQRSNGEFIFLFTEDDVMQSLLRDFFSDIFFSVSSSPNDVYRVAGQTKSLHPMAPLEGIQQSRPRPAAGAFLRRPRWQPASETTDCRRTRQCLNLLSSAGQHLQRPQLSEPQSLVDSADAEPERRSHSRGTGRRDAPYRNSSHPNEPDQNCELMSARDDGSEPQHFSLF